MRLHTNLLQAEVLGNRGPAHRDQQLLGPDLALVGLDADAVAGLLGAADLDAEAAVDARLLESAEKLLGHLFVLERDQAVEGLEQCHLDPELVVEGRELDAHSAGADDADRFGHRLGDDRVVGGDDVLAVESNARERLHDRAGGNDEVLRLHQLAVGLDRVAVAQPAPGLDDLDLVLLHQVLDALVELADDGVSTLGDARVVVAHDLRLEAELSAAGGDAVVELGRLEEGLGGDAPDVEARPAELAALDQGDLQAELGGANRGGITAHSATQDRNVKIGFGHWD